MELNELHEVRAMILQDSDSPDDLRKRWLEQDKLKEIKPVTISTSNFLDELVQDEVERIESAARAAKAQADESERNRLKALNTELKRHFSRLLDKGVGTIESGAYHFDYAGRAHSVKLVEGQFQLCGPSKPVKFSVDGDAVTALAKVLAKAS